MPRKPGAQSQTRCAIGSEALELAPHEHGQWAVGGLHLVDEAAEVLVEHPIQDGLRRPTEEAKRYDR